MQKGTIMRRNSSWSCSWLRWIKFCIQMMVMVMTIASAEESESSTSSMLSGKSHYHPNDPVVTTEKAAAEFPKNTAAKEEEELLLLDTTAVDIDVNIHIHAAAAAAASNNDRTLMLNDEATKTIHAVSDPSSWDGNHHHNSVDVEVDVDDAQVCRCDACVGQEQPHEPPQQPQQKAQQQQQLQQWTERHQHDLLQVAKAQAALRFVQEQLDDCRQHHQEQHNQQQETQQQTLTECESARDAEAAAVKVKVAAECEAQLQSQREQHEHSMKVWKRDQEDERQRAIATAAAEAARQVQQQMQHAVAQAQDEAQRARAAQEEEEAHNDDHRVLLLLLEERFTQAQASQQATVQALQQQLETLQAQLEHAKQQLFENRHELHTLWEEVLDYRDAWWNVPRKFQNTKRLAYTTYTTVIAYLDASLVQPIQSTFTRVITFVNVYCVQLLRPYVHKVYTLVRDACVAVYRGLSTAWRTVQVYLQDRVLPYMRTVIIPSVRTGLQWLRVQSQRLGQFLHDTGVGWILRLHHSVSHVYTFAAPHLQQFFTSYLQPAAKQLLQKIQGVLPKWLGPWWTLHMIEPLLRVEQFLQVSAVAGLKSLQRGIQKYSNRHSRSRLVDWLLHQATTTTTIQHPHPHRLGRALLILVACLMSLVLIRILRWVRSRLFDGKNKDRLSCRSKSTNSGGGLLPTSSSAQAQQVSQRKNAVQKNKNNNNNGVSPSNNAAAAANANSHASTSASRSFL